MDNGINNIENVLCVLCKPISFLPGYEIGDQDVDAANRAMDHHRRFLEVAVSIMPEPVITCHIGLIPDQSIDANRGMDNLGLMARRAKELGITLALENLRKGPAADPRQVWSWAEAADLAITLERHLKILSSLPNSPKKPASQCNSSTCPWVRF